MNSEQGDRFTNKVIFAIFFTVIFFTITVLVYNWRGLQVQDSLINSFFVLITFELGALGSIKITKTIKKNAKKNLGEPPPEETAPDEELSEAPPETE